MAHFNIVIVILIILFDFISIALSQATFHWFIIPVTLCGLIIVPEIVKWLRGIYDIFDPRGIFAFVGFYHFFVSPVLWVTFGIEMPYVNNPSDWRPWFGLMGFINIVGLLGYKLGLLLAKDRKKRKSIYILDWKVFVMLLSFFIGVGFIVWIIFMFKYRGIIGLILNYVMDCVLRRQIFAGGGTYLVFTTAVPMVLFTFWIAKIRRNPKVVTTLRLFLMSVAFVLLFVIFNPGLLLGSRGSIIFCIFVVAAMIHFNVKKIRRKHFFISIGFIIIFMYIWGFYKGLGVESLSIIKNFKLTELKYYESIAGRDEKTLFTEDLTRAPIQAYLCYKLIDQPKEYNLRWGETYLSAIIYVLVPRQLWPSKPLNSLKVEAGTDLMYGKGTREASSKVYGLAGEAMLNFNLVGVPIAYFILGLIMASFSNVFMNLNLEDSRRLIAPSLCLLLAISISSDFDNIISRFILSGGIWIILIVLLSSKKYFSRI